MITSAEAPSLGGVYKLAGSYKDNELIPKIKVSEDPEKINNPGYKKVVRIFDKDNVAQADLIMLKDEAIDTTKPLTIFHPTYTWKKSTFEDYTVKELHKPLFIDGECKYEYKPINEIKAYVNSQLETFWDSYKRLTSPKKYKTDLLASKKVF